MGQKRSKKRLRSLLMVITVLVWGAVIALSSIKFKMTAKTGVKVYLTATPANVRIQINGESQFDGLYTRTPITLVVPAGKSRMRILRDGYASQLVSVTGNIGDEFRMDSIVLGRRPEVPFVGAKFEWDPESPQLDKVNVDVHFGFASGPLPLAVDDLEAGRDYLVVLTAVNAEGRKTVHRCRYATDANSPVEGPPESLWVSKKGGRYKISGCRPVTEK